MNDRWLPTVAHLRAGVGAVVLTAIALIWQRADVLVIAAPMAVVATWSLFGRPEREPIFTDALANPIVREGDATLWRGDIRGDGIDLVVAVMTDAAWFDRRPDTGVVTVAAGLGPAGCGPSGSGPAISRGRTACLEIAVRSTRWGVRPVERVNVVAASTWAAFTWTHVTERHALTTLPLPAVFDSDAWARPTDGLIGLHRAARAGEGNEFAGLRPFRAGDRMRRINWARSTRSGELQVNSTWADQDTHVALVVDGTDDFGISEGIDGLASSLDATVRAAGAIAEHYALRGERVSMRAFGTAITHTVRPATGQAHARRILDTLARIRLIDASRAGYRVPARDPRGVTGGQLTVMLSPLIAPDALDLAVSLGRRGLPVIVVDSLPDHVATDDDVLTALAWRIRLLERRRELRLVQAAGIPVVRWRGPGSLDQVIRDISRRASGPRMPVR